MVLAQPNIEQQALKRRHQEHRLAQHFRQMLHEVDVDRSGTISLQELKNHTVIIDLFGAAGLEVSDLELFFNMLASIEEPYDEVSIDDFISGCLRMKGSATTFDLLTVGYEIKSILSQRKQ